jgi:purine-binding chemotaxis protein CheW
VFGVDILTFDLDGQRYGFPADSVVQVVQMVAISPLPGAPEVVEGVVNVRGSIVPVFDLRARLALPPRPIDPTQHLVILATGTRSSAVRVDAAQDLVSIPDDAIAGATTLAATGIGAKAARHVAGVAATADGTTIIYDLSAFLSLDESATLDHALAPTGV